MRDLRELRQTLVDHEDLAAGGGAVVEAAKRGAARIRRRRRVGYTAGVALAAAVALLAPAVVTHLGWTGTRAGPAGGNGYRGALQMTVDVDSGTGYHVITYGVVGRTQYLIARRGSGGNPQQMSVVVHDPGTYDGSRLLNGSTSP